MIEKAQQMTAWIISNVVSRKPGSANTISQSFCQTPFGIRSAGVGPNRNTRKLGYYNGN